MTLSLLVFYLVETSKDAIGFFSVFSSFELSDNSNLENLKPALLHFKFIQRT